MQHLTLRIRGWDADLLADELAALAAEAEGHEFDLEATGFDWGEIDALVAGGDTEDKGRAKILGKAHAGRGPGPRTASLRQTVSTGEARRPEPRRVVAMPYKAAGTVACEHVAWRCIPKTA